MAKWNGYTVSAAFAKIASAGDGPTSKVARANLDATMTLLGGSAVGRKKAEAIFGKGVELDRIKFTEWSPDTCGCKLVYMWHLDDVVEQRAHHPHSHAPCEHHAHLTDTHEHHAAVLAENQGKNRAIGALANKLGVKPEEVSFSFDGNRALTLDHPKLREG